MKHEIESFFNSQIAVAGFSQKKNKFGNQVLKALIKKGFNVIPIHPQIDLIEEKQCIKNLNQLEAVPPSLYICMQPDKAQFLIRDAINAGVKNIWFQQGGDFSRLAEIAREKGLNVIENKCLLMYAEPVKGIHACHRFINHLFKRN